MKPKITSDNQDAMIQQVLDLHQAGKLAEAVEQYNKLLNIFPNHPLLLAGLGTLAIQKNDFEQAIQLLEKSLKANPNQPSIFSNLGLALSRLNRLDAAVASYDQAIILKPDYADAYTNRGAALQGLNRFEEALDSFERAIALKPSSAEVYFNYGGALKNLKRLLDEALVSYDRAIELKPDFAVAYNNRGIVFQELKKFAEALADFDQAIGLRPYYVEAHNNRGIALQNLNQSEKAIASFDQAISLKPDYAEAYNNRGQALQEQHDFESALANYDQAISLKPDYAGAHWNKATLKLLTGDFQEGWRLYEWRWRDQQKQQLRNFSQPLWLGEQSVADKTVLIYPEQGFGDVIQFCRYATMLGALDAKVVIEAPASLMTLLSTLKGDLTLIEKGQSLPAFDMHCPIMSLPLAFKTTIDTIPAVVPYLYADPKKQQFWHDRLGSKTNPRVGLAWSGSSTHQNDHNRSIPLKLLEPLLSLPFEFHSLQKDIRLDDAVHLKQCDQVQLHHDYLYDFSDTAALISEMDIVISVDTSVAHLAGALAKPIWILLPFSADYRWLLNRSDSPWYPTATLFRQPKISDWSTVIAEVFEMMKGVVLAFKP